VITKKEKHRKSKHMPNAGIIQRCLSFNGIQRSRESRPQTVNKPDQGDNQGRMRPVTKKGINKVRIRPAQFQPTWLRWSKRKKKKQIQLLPFSLKSFPNPNKTACQSKQLQISVHDIKQEEPPITSMKAEYYAERRREKGKRRKNRGVESECWQGKAVRHWWY